MRRHGLTQARQESDTKTSDEAKGGDAAAAFNSAKELGTVEAWDAFLSNYPTGFHADLARAYVKKLSEGAPAATTAAVTVTRAHRQRPRARM